MQGGGEGCEGGGVWRAQPPPRSLRGKEAARGESYWDGKTGGRRGGGRGAGPCSSPTRGQGGDAAVMLTMGYPPPPWLLNLIPTACISYNKAPPVSGAEPIQRSSHAAINDHMIA